MDTKNIAKVLETSFYNLSKHQYSVLMKYGVVAGGAIRSLATGQEVKDIDVYFPHEALAHWFKEGGTVYKKRIITDNAVTLVNQVSLANLTSVGIKSPGRAHLQLIFRVSGTPEEVINSFDFTNCMGYYRFSDKKLYISPEMQTALETKQLVVHSFNNNPRTFFKRLNKFRALGYKISVAQSVKMLYKIMNAPIKQFFEPVSNDGY